MVTSTARKPHQTYHLADGTRVPGVTTVLSIIAKPALPAWANRLGFEGVNSTERLDFLAGAGSLAHELIAQQLGGPGADFSGYSQDQVSMAERALSGFHAWSDGKALEAHEIELSLTSQRYEFGGTLDALLAVDGVLTVVDWKTSEKIWPEHVYQISAYHNLLTETGYTVAEARIVRLSRDAGDEWSERVIPAPGLQPYFEVFKAALLLKGAIDATKERRGRFSSPHPPRAFGVECKPHRPLLMERRPVSRYRCSPKGGS